MMKDYIFSNDFSKNLDAMIYTCGHKTCFHYDKERPHNIGRGSNLWKIPRYFR